MRKVTLALVFLLAAMSYGSAKKTLDHADFDRWEKVTNYSLSDNGKWAAFAVNPQEGDGILYLHEVASGRQIEVKRGYKPSFSSDGKWAYALVKPYFHETRKARIAKKEGFDLPQDSIVIISLKDGAMEKAGRVISYRVPRKSGNCVAWMSCDTTLVSSKVLKNKKGGRPVVVRDLTTGLKRVINSVGDYSFSDDGRFLAVVTKKCKEDTIATDGVSVLSLADDSYVLIDRDKPFYGLPVFDRESSRLAYVASTDSAKTGTRKAAVFMSDISSGSHDPREIRIDAGKDLFVNQYTKPEFSYNGKRLIAGVAPWVAPDDTTLVSFENPSLDIWRWDSPYTPPQENHMVDDLRKKTFPVVVDLASGSQTLMTTDPLSEVTAPDRWDADWALVADYSKNITDIQWDYQFPVRLYVKNVNDGGEKEIGMVPNESYSLSPSGRYVIWFTNRRYFTFNIATGKTVCISTQVEDPLWDTDADDPVKDKLPYGIMGWTENDGRVLVYDRFDVISLDPDGTADPVCVTAGEGRKRNLRIRNLKTDPDFRHFKTGEKVAYSLFDYSDKRNGLASGRFSLKPSAPKIDFLGEYMIESFRKAKDADVYSWIQGNFSTSPNVYVSSGLVAAKTEKVTNSNPWMANYSWGTARLEKWYAYDGKPSEGVLYLPEDFDPDKEYPMLVYFYETYSQDLFRHYDMEPSWSWINFPFYVSRGYVVFVPDIHYSAGIPGENAYNYVCSGVDEICRRYPNIDRKRIGIDGQSWGGYQTAYLVTRTDMFACAGSGAPVSNMTSAYGGIRWGTGDSRQAQYEVGQSRIGRTLWEAPELYIANSPVFHADRVHTPLLIMHNDNDGAVPWYQGIEMFMALRRLGKPVWMLQYNGEAHNLKERRNRKDITRRLQQFFDHYLKGDPMPEWMRKGIPAIRKGQEFGY